MKPWLRIFRRRNKKKHSRIRYLHSYLVSFAVTPAWAQQNRERK